MRLGGHALQVSPAAPNAGSASTVLTEKKAASYPGVGLTTFRKARDVAKLQRAKDSDPIEARKLEKLKGGLDGGASRLWRWTGTASRCLAGVPATERQLDVKLQ